MTTFITLKNCAGNFEKQFRVLASGYTSVRERRNSMNRTWTGKLDNQVARSVLIMRYTFLVFGADLTDLGGLDTDIEGYGTLTHLTQFFEINSVETGSCSTPSFTPASRLIMTDFDGTDYNVLLVGPFHPINVGQLLDDYPSVYHVPVEIIVFDS